MVKVKWLLEQRILLVKVIGADRPEDVAAGDAVITQMLEASESDTIHVLLDTTQFEGVPNIKAQRDMAWRHDPRVGWVVVLGEESKVARFVTALISKVTGGHNVLVATYADALDTLKQVDPALPDLSALKQLEPIV